MGPVTARPYSVSVQGKETKISGCCLCVQVADLYGVRAILLDGGEIRGAGNAWICPEVTYCSLIICGNYLMNCAAFWSAMLVLLILSC